ncbi:MAG: hypothetical protein K1X92_07855 [Bacteroidia bacterium]|nr:hypothetical protein [Bacteroidia bacterium]
MFYKIALSLRDAGCDVAIVGTDRIKNTPSEWMGVKLTALPLFDRKGFTRFFRPFRLLKIAIQKKPDVLIVHSPELLMIAVLYKFFFRNKILVYDVLEDYRKNLRHHPFMGTSPKKLLSFAVSVWERFWIRFFDHVWYAEFCYDGIHRIPDDKKVCLVNRFTPKAMTFMPDVPLPSIPFMVCTGTLNRTWGVKKTLLLWQAFNEFSPLHLILSGFTFDEEVLPMIDNFVRKSGLHDRVTKVGLNEYVPYPVILHYIQHCTFGTGLYDLPPNIQGKIPTKFYEFLAMRKPLLFTEDPFWNGLNQQWNLGVPVNPDETAKSIYRKLKALPETHTASSVYSWEENEEKKLFAIVEKWKQKMK